MNRNFDRKDMTFAGILMLVHGLFFLLAQRFTRIYMGDSMEYIYEALNIKNHFFFYSGNPALPISPEYMTQRQPIYPLLLLGVYLFSLNNWIVIIVQNLISMLNIYYTRHLLLTLGFRKRYDWLLLLFVIAYPAQFINADTIAPDILLQSCTLLYFGNGIRLLQGKQLKHLLWMSVALIAGLLVKPVLYPFVVPHLVVCLAWAFAAKLPVIRVLAVALMPLLVVLLYNGWNEQRTGKFHFSSNQSFNAIYYFYPYLGHKVGPDSAGKWLASERKACDALPVYKDRYDYANREGVALLKQHFVPYMAYHLLHSARILVEPGKAEMDLFTGKLTYGRLYSKQQTGFYATLKQGGLRGLVQYLQNNPSLPLALLVLLFNVFRLLGLYLFCRCGQVPGAVRWFVLILVGYFALAAGPIANTRYFLPVSLIVIGCSSLGFTTMRRKSGSTA